MAERKKRIRKKADESIPIDSKIETKGVETEKIEEKDDRITEEEVSETTEIKDEININEKDIIESKEIDSINKESGVVEKPIDNEVKQITEHVLKIDDNPNNEIKKDIIEEINNKDLEEIQNKQIKMAVYFMISIILILVLVFFIKNNFIDKFNYKGLVFQKTQLGDIMFYSTRFPVVEITGQVIGDYAINLRNDPRKLAYIPINTTNKKIEFSIDKGKYDPVYISLNPFMKNCEDTGIALLELSGFLKDSGLDVRSAVTDKAYAEANNLTQRWCYNDAFDTVIIITDGNITTINEIAPGCYEIVFKECEVLQVSERFMLVVLEDYASRFERS